MAASKMDFEIRIITNPVGNLSTAVELVLDNPGAIGVQLRAILLKEEIEDFTAFDLSEIARILNPLGADLSIDPEDPLQLNAPDTQVYSHLVTSTNAELQGGAMGGNYLLDENGLRVSFRRPTVAEITSARFLTLQHWIPVITNDSYLIENLEQGAFTFEFNNRETPVTGLNE